MVMVLGTQMYTVRAYTQTVKDFDFTLGEIAKIGYKTVQLSAIGKDITPKIAKELCDKHGLSIVLTHSDVNRILCDTENLIEDHKQMNCRYIGIGSMPDKYRNPEWISHFAEDFKEPAKKIKEAGMLLMYHNHSFEFEKVNGRYLLEYLVDSFTPDELGFTLDTYWLQAAGNDVCHWIKKLSDRIPCVHLKDMAIEKREVVMAPVMEGNMNFAEIINTLKETNCEYALVEQDVCQESPFICLKKSYDNLKTLNLR